MNWRASQAGRGCLALPNLLLTALSLIIAELPVGSSMISLSLSLPHITLFSFFMRFLAFLFESSSSSISLRLSISCLTLLRTPSIFVTYPCEAGPGVTVVTWGIFKVAALLRTTLIFISSSEFISISNLAGSRVSADSISALWYLQLSQVIENKNTLPKYGTSLSLSLSVRVFSLHIGHSWPLNRVFLSLISALIWVFFFSFIFLKYIS